MADQLSFKEFEGLLKNPPELEDDSPEVSADGEAKIKSDANVRLASLFMRPFWARLVLWPLWSRCSYPTLCVGF